MNYLKGDITQIAVSAGGHINDVMNLSLTNSTKQMNMVSL